MKNIFIFTKQFPYGKEETYIESEMKYWDQYEKIFIFSLNIRRKNKKTKRETPENVEVIPILFQPIGYILFAFRTIFDPNFYKEIGELQKKKKLSISSLLQLLIYISRSHYIANVIYKKIRNLQINSENIVFYSYRFDYQPYVAYLLREKLKLQCVIISRAHGSDLYEYSKKTGYIPMRSFLLNNLKYCYPCSKDGTNYLKTCYPDYKSKIITQYLGTEDHGFINIERNRKFKIVSCSNIIELKRINLIIKALSLINEYEIEWTHFGDGPLREKLQAEAEQALGKNIDMIWKGQVSNETILKEYKENKYNLFINTSSSEGLPVSIMEAISYGIPCIATNAGGNSEIVIDKINGILLPLNSDEKIIADAIKKFIIMNETEYQNYCKNARIIWENNFSAKNNYEKFAKIVNNL